MPFPAMSSGRLSSHVLLSHCSPDISYLLLSVELSTVQKYVLRRHTLQTEHHGLVHQT